MASAAEPLNLQTTVSLTLPKELTIAYGLGFSCFNSRARLSTGNYFEQRRRTTAFVFSYADSSEMASSYRRMEPEEDFIRQAVLASINVEKKIENSKTEGNNVTEEKQKRKLVSSPRSRKGSRKGEENWKKLQKSLSASTQRPKVIRKLKSVRNKESAENKQSHDEAKFSSFMKREVRTADTRTRVVAMDCEMVGVGKDGKENALARVSIVNYAGDVLYDSFVKVHEPVTDYRTQWSGVRPDDVSPDSNSAAEPFEAQRIVGDLLKGRIVVGHAIKNDLRVLRLSHPWRDIRDTSDYYKRVWKRQGRRAGRGPALRVVVAQVLGVDSFQREEHDSCEDARAALALYKRNAKDWENSLKERKNRGRTKRRRSEPESHEEG